MTENTVVHVLLCDTWADWEIGFLTSQLARRSYLRGLDEVQLRYVTDTGDPVTSLGGMRVIPDLSLDDVDPADSAMLVLPGNDIWPTPAYDAALDAAGRFVTAGTPVAAICGATGGLARAGLLNGFAHTSNAPEFLAGIKGYGGAERYIAAPAVIDGPLVTASGVKPAHFAAAAIERLDVWAPEMLEAWRKLYLHDDPAVNTAGFVAMMELSNGG